MTRRSARTLLGLAAVAAAAATAPSAELDAQSTEEATYWRAAGLYGRAFGGEGWGGVVGVTHGLFSDGMLVGGVGVDVAWSRPRLSAERAPGAAPRRDLVTFDVHLRTRVLRGPLAFELGIPVGMVRSAVDGAGDTGAEPAFPRYNEPGIDVGGTVGLLGALRASVWSRLSILAEYEVVRAWVHGGAHWLQTYSLGLQAPLR